MAPLVEVHRSTDPGVLEALGKQAAELSETSGLSMTQAVVQTLGHEKLNSEQVRRVVEFANVEAFNRKFASLAGTHKIVHIDHGPADPVQVYQTLQAHTKRASIEDEYGLPPYYEPQKVSFHGTDRLAAGYVADIVELRERLKSAHEEVAQNLEAAQWQLTEQLEQLAGEVKRASLQGAAPAELLEAWIRVDDKLAAMAYKQLLPFMVDSNTKVAGRSIRPDTQVVRSFEGWAKTAREYAGYTNALTEIESELGRLDAWLTERSR